MACLEKGSFIGYEIVRDINDYYKEYILKLEIPKDAKRSSAMGIKCRCDKTRTFKFI